MSFTLISAYVVHEITSDLHQSGTVALFFLAFCMNHLQRHCLLHLHLACPLLLLRYYASGYYLA